jgi:hypothetical protein
VSEYGDDLPNSPNTFASNFVAGLERLLGRPIARRAPGRKKAIEVLYRTSFRSGIG